MPGSGPVLCEKVAQLHAMLHKDDESTLEAPFKGALAFQDTTFTETSITFD